MYLSARVKQLFEDQEQVTSREIREAVNALAPMTRLDDADNGAVQQHVMVEFKEGRLPFSKGILLRGLTTAGVSLEEGYQFTRDVEEWLQKQRPVVLTGLELDEYIHVQMEHRFGRDVKRRYLLTRWVQDNQTPLVVVIGGATGTGKSTVAMKLAARLGIRRVTGTDTIRETLRTVMSPSIVPELHEHSFRAMGDTGELLSNPKERALVGFHQQARQVGVGVKAVIRRAVREGSNIIVEGTHLVPPLHQYLPVGVDVHFAGLMLSVNSKRAHKKRFPERAKVAKQRQSSDYLDAFQAVRWIHDDLIDLADEHEHLVIPNSSLRDTVSQCVNYLSEVVPVEPRWLKTEDSDTKPAPSIPKTLFVILDGLADEPIPILDDKTPLQAAQCPNLNRLANMGSLGLVDTSPIGGGIPNTDEGLSALLRPGLPIGQLGRGLYEALGQGVPMVSGSILFRGNLATVQEDGLLADRRAGRIREGVSELLDGLGHIVLSHGITGHIYPGHEHRVILALQGPQISADVSDTDPGGNARISKALPAKATTDTEEARRTAVALNELLLIAAEHLNNHPVNQQRITAGLYPANAILTRGAASARDLPEVERFPYPSAMISACSTALGLGRMLHMNVVTAGGMTGNLETDVGLKFQTAKELLVDHSFVAVHFKGTDVAAHDRKPMEKMRFLERFDAQLGVFLDTVDDVRIVVSADHGTSSRTGNHLPDPVPLMVTDWHATAEEEVQDAIEFDEEHASDGLFGTLVPSQLFDLLHPESFPPWANCAPNGSRSMTHGVGWVAVPTPPPIAFARC